MRLNITVEGPTEENFVSQTLKPHLHTFSVGVNARVVVTKEIPGYTYSGGLNRYSQAQYDIMLWLREDKSSEARFTTMFDLYDLPTDFPGYAAALQNDAYQRVEALEEALAEDISDPRFIPYIQLHEFEALLLSDPQKFETQFVNRADEISRLVEMVSEFSSPEHINCGIDTAPSKRIGKEIPEYKHMKATVGPIVAEKIGLPTLRSKCSHFAEWLAKLENLGQ